MSHYDTLESDRDKALLEQIITYSGNKHVWQ